MTTATTPVLAALATIADTLRTAVTTAATTADQAALTTTADLIADHHAPPPYAIRRLDAVLLQLRDRHASTTDPDQQAAWHRTQDHIRAYTNGDNYRVTLHDHTHARHEIVVRATAPDQAVRRALRDDPLYVTAHHGPTLAPDRSVTSVAQLTINGPRATPKASS